MMHNGLKISSAQWARGQEAKAALAVRNAENQTRHAELEVEQLQAHQVRVQQECANALNEHDVKEQNDTNELAEMAQRRLNDEQHALVEMSMAYAKDKQKHEEVTQDRHQREIARRTGEHAENMQQANQELRAARLQAEREKVANSDIAKQ